MHEKEEVVPSLSVPELLGMACTFSSQPTLGFRPLIESLFACLRCWDLRLDLIKAVYRFKFAHGTQSPAVIQINALGRGQMMTSPMPVLLLEAILQLVMNLKCLLVFLFVCGVFFVHKIHEKIPKFFISVTVTSFCFMFSQAVFLWAPERLIYIKFNSVYLLM